MSEERRRDGHSRQSSAACGSRKWDGSGASVNGVKKKKAFHIHALLGARSKRDGKTTAAGARPSRHERGE